MELRVDLTGVRSGETIIASPSGKQNAGTKIIVKGDFPINYLALPDDLNWSIYYQQLRAIPAFSNKSDTEIMNWIHAHNVQVKDHYLSDYPNLMLKFVSIGGRDFLALGPEVVDMLLAGNPNDPDGYWTMEYVYNLFPKKSRAYRHTLIFRPGNWVVDIQTTDENADYHGLIININNGETYQTYTGRAGDYIIQFDKQTWILTTKHPQLDLNSLKTIISKYIKNISDFDAVVEKIKWFSPAVHKSLIQKIIRTGAEKVDEYNSDLVLLISISLLALHQGAFVPDIQRYVSGLESAAKRLAVSILEDSYSENSKDMLILLAAAGARQIDRDWWPSLELFDRWFGVALKARKDIRMFEYSTKPLTKPIPENNTWSYCYKLLGDIRSFETDINMVGWIAYHQGLARKVDKEIQKIETMPIIHCIDHHSLPEIGYYFDYNLSQATYTELFSDLFSRLTGINPRKGSVLNEDDAFVKNARKAQALLWLAKSKPNKNIRSILPTTQTFNYEFDDSYLAGLIGEIDYTKYITVILTPSLEFMVVKRPSRTDKELKELEPDVKTKAIEYAKQKLQDGIGDITYVDGIFYINNIQWSEYKKQKITVNELEPIDLTLENSIMSCGDGVCINAHNQLLLLLNSLDHQTKSRLAIFIRTNSDTLGLFKINKEGVGSEFKVNISDTRVMYVLSCLSLLYPAALEKKNTTDFKIKNQIIFRSVRDLVLDIIADDTLEGGNWPEVADSWNRIPTDYQTEALEKLRDENRGHLIWIDPGAGKTYIVLQHLKYLIETRTMPMYCVYTLPSSAWNSIVKEIQAFGFEIHEIDMNKKSNPEQKQIQPYKINLIEHDDLRKNSQLKELSGNMFFVVDEFHKTISSKTIRTSTTFEIVKTAHGFIGMSGSPLYTEDKSQLINWLSLVVDYHITDKNFFTAVANLIAKRVATHVIVDRIDHEINMNEQSRSREYYNLVSPALGGTNKRMTAKQFREAIDLCYELCFDLMVDLVVQFKERVFLVAKDQTQQDAFNNALLSRGFKANQIFVVGKNNTITLNYNDNTDIKVVITTIRYNAGYTITKMNKMITSVYFSNLGTRQQLEARINRKGQLESKIEIHTVYTGILGLIMTKYERARSLGDAMKLMAEEVQLVSE